MVEPDLLAEPLAVGLTAGPPALQACVWRYWREALRFLASLRFRFTLGFS
jgi:hypothetical protein